MSVQRSLVPILSALALGTGFATAASAATVNYAGLQPLADYSDVTTFGSTPEVAITARSFTNNAAKTTTVNHVEFWNAGYSNQPAVVFANANGQGAQLTLTPIAGYTVNLLSFQVGSYLAGADGVGPDRTASLLRVIEVGTGSVLWDQSGLVVNTTKTLLPGVGSIAGLSIQWGYDWNIGLNNLTFDAVRTGSISVVPVPPAVALFLGGLGLIGWAGRRRS